MTNNPVKIGDATLYHADCMDVLPTLEGVDCVITDPPYGLHGHNMRRAASMMPTVEWDKTPANVQFILDLNIPSIIWGGNYFYLPPNQCFLIWDKNNAGRSFADIEMAWTNFNCPARRIIKRPMNMDGGKLHPSQKPLEVMKWCIGFTEGTILDPFMGSGTTGVAALRLRRKFIGIEIDEKYFQIACERIRKEADQGKLFQ